MSNNRTDETLENRIQPVSTHTKILSGYNIEEIPAQEQRQRATLAGNATPWRVAVTVQSADVQIVFDITASIVLGRSYPHTELFKGIDLSPYDAYQKGVSRNHATISLKDGKVVINDNNSANGTLLNGKRLKPLTNFVLRTGDIVSLGNLELRFELLYDPFEV